MNKTIEELYKKYNTDVMKFSKWLCSCKIESEDVAQESWKNAVRSFHQYNQKLLFKPWMFAIVFNAFNDILRRTKKTKRIEKDEMYISHVLSKRQSLYNDINDLLKIDNYLDDYMLNLLFEIETDKSKAFLLYCICNYSYKEISALLSIPIGTVMTWIYRTKNKLRKKLIGYEYNSQFN